MFAGSLAPRAFLDSLPADMVASVAEGCARMAFTRGEELFGYAALRRRG